MINKLGLEGNHNITKVIHENFTASITLSGKRMSFLSKIRNEVARIPAFHFYSIWCWKSKTEQLGKKNK